MPDPFEPNEPTPEEERDYWKNECEKLRLENYLLWLTVSQMEPPLFDIAYET